jgi:hypothetical protein
MQRKKTRSIMECIKGVHDTNKLQAKLIVAQTQKKDHQAQMEPLQEWVAKVIVLVENANNSMAQTQAECARMISNNIAVQVLEALKGKTTHAQTQGKELTKNFQEITGEIDEAHRFRWLRTSHMSMLGPVGCRSNNKERLFLEDKNARAKIQLEGKATRVHAWKT